MSGAAGGVGHSFASCCVCLRLRSRANTNSAISTASEPMIAPIKIMLFDWLEVPFPVVAVGEADPFVAVVGVTPAPPLDCVGAPTGVEPAVGLDLAVALAVTVAVAVGVGF